MPKHVDLYMDAQEARETLCCSAETLREYLAQGKIKAHRLNKRRFLYLRKSVMDCWHAYERELKAKEASHHSPPPPATDASRLETTTAAA